MLKTCDNKEKKRGGGKTRVSGAQCSFVILWDILDPSTRHLQQHQASGRTLVPVEGLQFALVHLCRGLIVRHEDEAAQVGPLVDDFLEALHHPAGEAAALELLDDEDVGEVGECDVVGYDTGEADEFYVGAVWSPRSSVVYLRLN